MSRLKCFILFPVLTFIVMTMDSLRVQLDEDEAHELRRGHTPPHTVAASAFIWNAIEIEGQQYVPPCTAIIQAANLSL